MRFFCTKMFVDPSARTIKVNSSDDPFARLTRISSKKKELYNHKSSDKSLDNELKITGK